MRIALIGSAPSSVHLGPYQAQQHNDYLGGKPPPAYPPSEFIDQDWGVWCCSPGAFAVVPRADRWFEVHRWEPGKTWFSPEYCQFLRQFRGPVYTGGVVEELANGVVYPIERVEEEFSSYFLTSSLSLMAALAILEIEDNRKRRAATDSSGAMLLAGNPVPIDYTEDTIAFFGVDMAAQEEWQMQRPGCQFFILEALRRGIGVYVPRESDLTRPEPVYGLCEWDHNYIKATARMRELNSRAEAAQAAANQGAQQLHFLNGAKDNMSYWIKTWMSPYGVPCGVRNEQIPGTGLGGGVTLKTPYAAPFGVPLAQPEPLAPLTTTCTVESAPPTKKKAKSRRK